MLKRKRSLGIKSVDKNFTINNSDGFAYTEDKVLVTTIFAYNLTKKASEKDVTDYFKACGEIAKIDLISDVKHRREHRNKYCFITFEKPASAVSALAKEKPELHGKRFGVKAANTWRQIPQIPKNKKVVKEKKKKSNDKKSKDKKSNDEISNANNSCTILILNDDCLENICKYLKTLDLLRFANVCMRFREVAKMRCKIEFIVLKFERLVGLTLQNIRQLLKLAGPFVKSLAGDVPQKDCRTIMSLINKYCPNLQVVKISKPIKTTSLRALLLNLHNICELHLIECSLKQNGVLVLGKVLKLKKLSLSKNVDITGRYLSLLTGVTELDLSCCRSLKSTEFGEVCRKLKNLKKLNIFECELLNADAFNQMAENCVKLEELRMSSLPLPYECIAKLPQLKCLEIHCIRTRDLRPELFIELAKYNQLEYLKISGQDLISFQIAKNIGALTKLKTLICPDNSQLTDECLSEFSKLTELMEIDLSRCIHITNIGLLELVRQCKKLSSVDVQNCKEIKDNFVFSVIKCLREKQLERKETIAFIVTGTGISQFILNDAKYLAAESLLKLIFDTKSNKKNAIFRCFDFFEDNNHVHDFIHYAVEIGGLDSDEEFDLEHDIDFDDVDDDDFYDGMLYDDDDIDQDDDYIYNRMIDNIHDIHDFF